MPLKRKYDSQDDIPEGERDFYVERDDGTFELDLEGGFKTEDDVTRLRGSLDAERREHKATKRRFAAFGDDVTPETIQSLRDENEDLKVQLEAAGSNAPDETKLEPIIQRRAEALLRPVQRELKQASEELETLRSDNTNLKQADRRRRMVDELRLLTTSEKGVKLRHPTVLQDVEILAERQLEEDEAGNFVTRDLPGLTPGLPPAEWLREIQSSGTRPTWFPENEPAGADGGRGGRGGAGDNPLLWDKPNITAFSKIVKENPQQAVRFAKAAKRTDVLPRELRPS